MVRLVGVVCVACSVALGCSSSSPTPDGGDVPVDRPSDIRPDQGQAGTTGAGGGAGGQGGTAGGAAGTTPDGGPAGQDGGQAGADAPVGDADGSTADGSTIIDAGLRDRPEAATPLGAPTNLTAVVKDRRQTSIQLSWTAPTIGAGANLTGYEVRYSKAAITDASFDSPATSLAPYTGTPAAAGQPDGVVVSNLYVENEYYFAVAAIDAAGGRTRIATTATPVAGRFNVFTIPAFTSTDAFGFSVNGEGDLNGDGKSDLLVGTFGAGKAYLYLGAATFAPAAPNVTFTGAGTSFGACVSQVGDIDKDGLPDLAISDQTNLQVFIYKGRATWPATLSDTQADYVIGADATYAASAFAASMARLGDFNGDGTDDFAIGARNFNASVGRVVVVLGRTGFTSMTLPDTAHSITIDGDATVGKASFGASVVGLGHFYTSTAGTTLIVGSPGTASSPTANAGRVYAFHGQGGTAGAIPLASNDQVITGPAMGTFVGQVLSNMGPLVGQYPNLGIGMPSNDVEFTPVRGGAYIMSGTPATGPLSKRMLATQSGLALVGAVILGGGVSGRDVSLSLIGDSKPDVLMAAQMGNYMTIADGRRVSGLTDEVDFTMASSEVTVLLPTGWGNGNNGGSLLPDIDGDGRPDFAIRKATAPGAVAVYY
jgi:hypothetical protein